MGKECKRPAGTELAGDGHVIFTVDGCELWCNPDPLLTRVHGMYGHGDGRGGRSNLPYKAALLPTAFS